MISLHYIKRLLLNRRVKYLLAHSPHMLLGVALVLVFSRLVPKEEFGVFARSFAFVNIVGAFLYGWLQVSMLRFANGVDQKRPPTWGSLVCAASFPVLPLFGLAFLLAEIDVIEHPTITALATAGYSLSVSFSQYARGANQPLLYGLIGAVRMLGVLAFAFIAVVGFPDARALVLALGVGALASVAVGLSYLWWASRAHAAKSAISVEVSGAVSLRDLLNYGAPASLSLVTVMLLIHADRFVASVFLTPGELGLYSAQVDLARQMVYPIISAVGVSLLPTAIRLEKERGKEAAEHYVFKESSFLLAVVTPLIVLAVFYSAEIFRTLLPVEYASPIGWAGPITALAAAVTGLRLLRFDPIFQLALQKENVFYSAVSGLAAWMVLAWPLASLAGVNGLAALGLVAATVSCIVAFILAGPVVPSSKIVSARGQIALLSCCVVMLVDKFTGVSDPWDGVLHLIALGGLMMASVVLAVKIKVQSSDA